jgi:hypothetical protein
VLIESLELTLQWAQHVVDVDVIDIENVTEALKSGPYGVCIYEAGNDVVDHQVSTSVMIAPRLRSGCQRRV